MSMSTQHSLCTPLYYAVSVNVHPHPEALCCTQHSLCTPLCYAVSVNVHPALLMHSSLLHCQCQCPPSTRYALLFVTLSMSTQHSLCTPLYYTVNVNVHPALIMHSSLLHCQRQCPPSTHYALLFITLSVPMSTQHSLCTPLYYTVSVNVHPALVMHSSLLHCQCQCPPSTRYALLFIMLSMSVSTQHSLCTPLYYAVSVNAGLTTVGLLQLCSDAISVMSDINDLMYQ